MLDGQKELSRFMEGICDNDIFKMHMEEILCISMYWMCSSPLDIRKPSRKLCV